MKKIIGLCLVSLSLIALPTRAMKIRDIDLAQYLLKLKYNPAYKKDKRSDWRKPTIDEVKIFIQTVRAIETEQYQTAAQLAPEAGFDVIKINDTVTEQTYYLLEEITPYPQQGNRAAGTYVFNPNAQANIAIEVPHPLHDRYTPQIAVTLFFKTKSRWYIVSGTHRQGSPEAGGCDHMSSLSTPADAAHNIKHFFFAAHYALTLRTDTLKFMQIHGMSDSSVIKIRKTCYSSDTISSDNKRFLVISEGGVNSNLNPSPQNANWDLIDFLHQQFSPANNSNILACFYRYDVENSQICQQWPLGFCLYTNIWGANQVESRITNDPDHYTPKNPTDYYQSNICTNGKPGINSHRFIHIEATASIRNNPDLRNDEINSITRAIKNYYKNKE